MLLKQGIVGYFVLQKGGVLTMEKEQYISAEVEVITFSSEDVIVTSGCGSSIETRPL